MDLSCSILSLSLEELEKKMKDGPKVGESVTGFFTSVSRCKNPHYGIYVICFEFEL